MDNVTKTAIPPLFLLIEDILTDLPELKLRTNYPSLFLNHISLELNSPDIERSGIQVSLISMKSLELSR